MRTTTPIRRTAHRARAQSSAVLARAHRLLEQYERKAESAEHILAAERQLMELRASDARRRGDCERIVASYALQSDRAAQAAPVDTSPPRGVESAGPPVICSEEVA